MDFHLFAFSAVAAGVVFGFCTGCSEAGLKDAVARSEARREARAAAFDPLRPDPRYRLLPDRPKTHLNASARPEPTAKLIEPPVIWEGESVNQAGLKFTTSKFLGQNLQIYMVASRPFSGTLRAIAKNASFAEIARAKATVAFEAEDAGYVEFKLPGKFTDDEVKLLIIEVAK